MNIRITIRNFLGIKPQKNWGKEFDNAVQAFKTKTDELEREMWKHRNLLQKGEK